MTSTVDFFSLKAFPAPELFDGAEQAWDALKRLSDWCRSRVKRSSIQGKVSKRAVIEGPVIIEKGTVVEAGAHVKGPAWIGRDCEIRHGAYLRGDVIVGDGAVIGNSCEVKHSVIGREGQVPHLAYVGDSVLGCKTHLGAGVIASNVKLNRETVKVVMAGHTYDTGLVKFGAIVGDETEIGCNCVLNPGSVIGSRCLMYPNVSWQGYLASKSIVKFRTAYQILPRRSVS